MIQQKATADGTIKRWQLDVAAMARTARWEGTDVERLRDEVEKVLAAFPTMLCVVGQPLGDDRCWVEAAEPLLCPAGDHLIVFDDGTRCVECGREVEPPADAVIGFVGRIPALISGRPFERSLDRRIAELAERDEAAAGLWHAALVSARGKRYLAPRYHIWFAESYPHSDPPVMVWPEYFPMLDIPPDHVYHADQYYRLCLYAAWREQPCVRVLQNRVVPRLLIDLMVADLQAVERLDAALDSLDVTLYELYNMVGREQQTERFRAVYRDLVPGA